MKRMLTLSFLLCALCSFALAGEPYNNHNQGPTPTNEASASSKASAESNATGVGVGIGIGGKATGGSVSHSGNSTVDNTVKSTNEQGQAQQQQQSADASNNGNGSNNASYSTVQVHQAPTVIAPDAYPTAPCRVGMSGGGSWLTGGVSLGGSKMDNECDKRETARSFALIGNRVASAKILCTTKAAKAAGLTAADCASLESAQITPPAPPSDLKAVVITAPSVNPNPTVVVPAPIQSRVMQPVHLLMGICTFPAASSSCSEARGNPAHATKVCDEMLNNVVDAMTNDPHAVLHVIGSRNSFESSELPHRRAESVKSYMVMHGIDVGRISLGQSDRGDRTTVLWLDSLQ